MRRLAGNLFSDYVFEQLKNGEMVEVEGPQGDFILHEKSERPVYFLAFDGGFAPIKSLVEHAMSLEINDIHLHWMASDTAQLYLSNVGRAWGDALDNFHYSEHLAGFDLRALSAQREAQLLQHLQALNEANLDIRAGDVYLAGPEAAVVVAEKFFLSLDMPKSRVFVAVVR